MSGDGGGRTVLRPNTGSVAETVSAAAFGGSCFQGHLNICDSEVSTKIEGTRSYRCGIISEAVAKMKPREQGALKGKQKGSVCVQYTSELKLGGGGGCGSRGLALGACWVSAGTVKRKGCE